MKKPYLMVGLILALALAWTAAELLSRGTTADPVSPSGASEHEQELTGPEAADLETHREAVVAEPAEPEAAVMADVSPPRSQAPVFEPTELPGWYVWGALRDEHGRQLTGDNWLDLQLRYGEHEPVRDETYLRASRYAAFLPLPRALASIEPAESCPGPIEIAVEVFGFRPRSQEIEDRLPSPLGADVQGRTLRVDFDLEALPRLRGRVLTTDGAPVSDACVNVRFEGEGWMWDDWQSRRALRLRKTDAEGSFAIPAKGAGEALLNAMKFGVGTGSIGPLPIDPSGDTALPDLILEGPGEVRGVVVYPDGSAAREVEVYAIMLDARDALPGGFCTWEAPIHLLEDAQGLPFGWDTTGADGRFRIGGLAPGTCGFRVGEWIAPDLPDLHRTGTQDIRLVWDRYRLEVLVRDEAGAPIPRADCCWKTTTLRGTSWSGSGDLYDGSGWRAIAPGVVFVYAYAGDRKDWRRVAVPEGQYETRVELTLRAPEPARLLLSITGPEGESVGDVETALFMESTRIGLQFDRLTETEGRPGEYCMEVPVGRFDLELDPEHLLYSTRTWEGFVVDPEEEDPLPIRLEKGGRLRLTAHLTDSQEEVPYRASEVWLEGQKLPYWIGFIDPRWPETYVGSPTSMPVTGIPYTTGWDPLAPGSYRIELTAEGYVPVERSFRILPGEIAEVEAWLSPK